MMLFKILSYIFGVKTKYILDTEINQDKTCLDLSIVELDIVTIWVFYFCRLTTDKEITFSAIDKTILNELKNEFYYKFIGKLMLFTKEVDVNGKYFMVSNVLNSLPLLEESDHNDNFLCNRVKTRLYGVASKDMESRKIYKHLIKLVKGIK